MSDIHEKILNLRKIISERGATEAEALTAIELADKLMKKYGITEEELQKVNFNKDMKTGTVDKENKSLDPASKYCGVMIAKFCEVKVWKTKEDSNQVLKFFGLNGDVEMAEYLFDLVKNAMRAGWRDYLRRNDLPKDVSKHKLYEGFHFGFGKRINEKLAEMISARTVITQSNGKDLLILKNEMVSEAFDNLLSLKLKEGRSRALSLDGNSVRDGMKAGDGVNLNRPLKSNSSVLSIT